MGQGQLAKESLSKVVHCKREPYDVLIGRPSRWGNPFVIGRHGSRAEVIQLFEGWLRTGNGYGCPEATEERRQDILNHLPELKGKVLGCWCGPKQDCHGRVLLDLLAQLDQPT